jgi:carbon storage regulator
MLVLSRKESQRIRLGDSIVVTIVKISGDKVRIGIEAPSEVLVLRDELEQRHPAPADLPLVASEPAMPPPQPAAAVALRQSA